MTYSYFYTIFLPETAIAIQNFQALSVALYDIQHLTEFKLLAVGIFFSFFFMLQGRLRDMLTSGCLKVIGPTHVSKCERNFVTLDEKSAIL